MQLPSALASRAFIATGLPISLILRMAATPAASRAICLLLAGGWRRTHMSDLIPAPAIVAAPLNTYCNSCGTTVAIFALGLTIEQAVAALPSLGFVVAVYDPDKGLMLLNDGHWVCRFCAEHALGVG